MTKTTVNQIRAEAHTDDHKFEHEFDAISWFEQAGPEEIFALAECGWGGDYPADAVAQYMSRMERPLETMLTYLTATFIDGGFECHVDAGDAMNYLKDCRPEMYDCIKRELGDAGSPPHSRMAEPPCRRSTDLAFGIEWREGNHTEGFINQEWSIAIENIEEPLRSQVLALAHQAAGQQEAPRLDCGCPLSTKNKHHTCS